MKFKVNILVTIVLTTFYCKGSSAPDAKILAPAFKYASGENISTAGDDYHPVLLKDAGNNLILVFGSNTSGNHQIYITKSSTAYANDRALPTFSPSLTLKSSGAVAVTATSRIHFGATMNGANVDVYFTDNTSAIRKYTSVSVSTGQSASESTLTGPIGPRQGNVGGIDETGGTNKLIVHSGAATVLIDPASGTDPGTSVCNTHSVVCGYSMAPVGSALAGTASARMQAGSDGLLYVQEGDTVKGGLKSINRSLTDAGMQASFVHVLDNGKADLMVMSAGQPGNHDLYMAKASLPTYWADKSTTTNPAPGTVVRVISASSSLTTFQFLDTPNAALTTDITCSIAGLNITCDVPGSTTTTALVATFTASAGATVSITATAQVSGTTANNFSTNKVYTVTAEDGATSAFTVTVNKLGTADTTFGLTNENYDIASGTFDGSGKIETRIYDLNGATSNGYSPVNSAGTVDTSNNKIYLVVPDAFSNGCTDWMLIRLSANGTLDGNGAMATCASTFATSGRIYLPGTKRNENIVRLSPGGSIVIGSGGFGAQTEITWINKTTGAIDTGFGTASSGKYTMPLYSHGGSGNATTTTLNDIKFAPNGDLIVLESANTNNGIIISRVLANGTGLDTSFGTSGKYTLAGTYIGTELVRNSTNGNIAWVGGSATNGGDMAIGLLSAAGSPVTSFDGDGVKVESSLDGSGFKIANITCCAKYGGIDFDGNGKIVAGYGGAQNAGSTRHVVMRYNLDGTLDTSFNTTGYVYLHPTASTRMTIRNVKVVGTTIYASGAIYDPAYYGASRGWALHRIKSDGTQDTGWGLNSGTTGLLNTEVSGGYTHQTHMEQDSNGNFIIFGRAECGNTDQCLVFIGKINK